MLLGGGDLSPASNTLWNINLRYSLRPKTRGNSGLQLVFQPFFVGENQPLLAVGMRKKPLDHLITFPITWRRGSG